MATLKHTFVKPKVKQEPQVIDEVIANRTAKGEGDTSQLINHKKHIYSVNHTKAAQYNKSHEGRRYNKTIRTKAVHQR
jgi:hypothetical protein